MLNALRNRNILLLSAAQLLSSSGNWILFIAAPFFVLHLTGSVLESGITFAWETIPAVVLAPLAGLVADRYDKRLIMVSADVARAATVLAMLAVHTRSQLWIVYAAVVVEAGFTQLFEPARRSLLPAITNGPDELLAANSVGALVDGLVRLVAAPIGGVLYAAFGFHVVLIVDAATYIASGLLLSGIFSPPAIRVAEASEPWRRGLFHGFATVRSSRTVAAIIGSSAVFFVGNGMITALLVAYIGHTLHGDGHVLGYLFGALGAGYLLGGPLAQRLLKALPSPVAIVGSLMVMGIGMGVAFNVHLAVADGFLFVLLGIPTVTFLVATITTLQTTVGQDVLGRVMAVYLMSQSLTMFLGTVLGSALGAVLSVQVALDVACALVVLSAGPMLMLARIPDSRATEATASPT